MKSTAVRFLLPVSVLAVVFATLVLYGTYRAAEDQISQLLSEQTALTIHFDMAINDYISSHDWPVATAAAEPGESSPEAMRTSDIARNRFEEDRRLFPEWIIKFSSDDPRNPANRAGPEESRMIAYFNQHLEATSWSGVVKLDGRDYFATFRPRRARYECLHCHGDPRAAPAQLVQRYGDTAAFGWIVGQVIAVDTVAAPMDKVRAVLASVLAKQWTILVPGLVLLFGSIAVIFRVVVAKRLRTIADHFAQMSRQTDDTNLAPLPVRGQDEIAALAVGFNVLRDKLHTAHLLLERRVHERTAALAQANEELGRAKLAAESVNLAKTEFLANMSHEIRTPMTAVLGFSDVLDEELTSPPPRRECHDCRIRRKGREHVSTIRRNGEHLLGILNDILDLSKIEAGKLQLEQLPCSVCEMMAGLQSLLRVRADAKRLRLEVEYAGPVPETIRTDPMRLRQILFNLLGNAVKFTERGGVRVVVRFLPADGGGMAVALDGHAFPDSTAAQGRGHATLGGPREPMMQFDVIDTGIGIDPQHLGRLFQPFTQADASVSRRFGGTGLGLAISNRLAELLGGRVTVESTPGAGSKFTLLIRVSCPEGVRMIEDPAVEGVLRPAAPESAPALGGRGWEGEAPAEPQRVEGRILLAEDGPDNQRLIAHLLRKAGAEVAVAENGLIAVEMVRSAAGRGEPFAAVLMDMQMPVMDGYTATGELRRSGFTGPIIALTAHAMVGDRQKCLDAGCDDYAAKPIDRRRLLAVLRRHLPLARSRPCPAPV